MTPRDYWNRYVAANNGPAGVSKKLRIPYSTIAGICNGHRGVGKRLAARMAKADPSLDASRLIWITQISAPPSGQEAA